MKKDLKEIIKQTEEEIAKAMEDNPELPYEFVKNILIVLEEARAGLFEPYEFGD